MKILVIGGGLAGVQSAYFLLQDGHAVTLIEKNEGVALETSFANGGLLTPSHAAPWNSPGIFKILLNSIGKEDGSIYVKLSTLGQYLDWGRQFIRNSTRARFNRTIERNLTLARHSQKCLQHLLDDVPIDFSHEQNGSMMIYNTAQSFSGGLARIDELKKYGVKAKLCSADELGQIEPALLSRQTTLAGGIFFKDDGHGDANAFTKSLAAFIEQHGVKFEMNTNVLGFVRRGKQIAGIRTEQGEIEADAIVIAAGHWSFELLKDLGVNLPVRPVKGSSLSYQLPDWADGPKMPIVDDDLHVAVTPIGQAIRIVGTAEFCGIDATVRPERMAMLKRLGMRILPQLAEQIEGLEPSLQWSAHRPMTPDCMPILGKCGIDNVYLNTGHGYLGWTTGTGTSKAVADMVSGREPELNMADYGLARF